MILLAVFFGMLSVSAENITLFSFENAKNLRQWLVRRGTAFAHTSWPDGHPGGCGRITYYKYDGGKELWPGIVLRFQASDWRNVEFLSMDIYAAQPGALQMELRDKKEIKMGFKLPLKTGRNRIRQSLTGARGFSKLNIREVCQLHLYLTKPASEQVYYLGDVQLLTRDLSSAFDALSKRLDVYRKWDFRGFPEAENVCGRH